MYGLNQEFKIDNDKLKLHMENFGYKPEPVAPGLWRRKTRPLQFLLVLDDFEVKYEHQVDITHIIYSLKTI